MGGSSSLLLWLVIAGRGDLEGGQCLLWVFEEVLLLFYFPLILIITAIAHNPCKSVDHVLELLGDFDVKSVQDIIHLLQFLGILPCSAHVQAPSVAPSSRVGAHLDVSLDGSLHSFV